LDRVIEEAERYRERLDQFDAHGFPNVASALDRVNAAEARAAAREALAVLTRLADSAAYWSDYDVPVGLVADVDAAKARLAGVLGE